MTIFLSILLGVISTVAALFGWKRYRVSAPKASAERQDAQLRKLEDRLNAPLEPQDPEDIDPDELARRLSGRR